jgi:hypothetical protein
MFYAVDRADSALSIVLSTKGALEQLLGPTAVIEIVQKSNERNPGISSMG